MRLSYLNAAREAVGDLLLEARSDLLLEGSANAVALGVAASQQDLGDELSVCLADLVEGVLFCSE